MIGTIALIIYSHWELLVSAFFGSVNHEWLLILTILKKIVEVKLKGGNVLTECAIIVLASLAPGAGYQTCFCYSSSENPYVRKTWAPETVSSGCYCLKAMKTAYIVCILDVVWNKFQNVQLGFIWFVAMSKSFNT